MAELLSKRVAILAGNGFEEEELTDPRNALIAADALVDIVSPAPSPLRAWDHTDWSDEEYEVDVALADADPTDYDMLVLPGGVMNPDNIRHLEPVQAFVQHFFTNDKSVAAICHAPWILIDAGVADGRQLTAYHSIRTDLRNAGADVRDEPVVVDGNLITSRNPGDMDHFVNTMITTLRAVQPDSVDYREAELEASSLSDHPSPTDGDFS